MPVAKLLPKWLMKRYLIIWKKLGSRKFTFKEAQKILNWDERYVSIFLSELNKAGWIKGIELDKNDGRKRIYQLEDYEIIFNKIVSESRVGRK